MAFRGGNYNFVIDSSFTPFTMQEMLVPLTAYKEAFEKSEEAYTDLRTKADVFKDLSESLPEDSKARQIYEGYANDLRTQAEDLARNGLNMGNRRALASLKQRYSGEIGRLDRAKTAMDEAKKMRSTLEASGKRRLYATNNFTIDDFLDGGSPNMYSVDPDVLYAKGAQRGKSVSSRMTDIREGENMIDGYFRNVIQSVGMNPRMLSQWMQSDDFNKMIDLAMVEEGVAGNLTGADYLRAKQSYISGIFDGVIYTEKNDLQRNPNMLTPKERHDMANDDARMALQRQSQALENLKYTDSRKDYYNSLMSQGYVLDSSGNIVGFDESKSLAVQKAKAIKAASSGKSSSSGSGGGSTEHKTKSKNAVRFHWKHNDPNKKYYDPEVFPFKEGEDEYPGTLKSYDELPPALQRLADKRIGSGKAKYYDYYHKPYDWGLLNDDEEELVMVPRDIEVDDATDYSVLDVLDE